MKKELNILALKLNGFVLCMGAFGLFFRWLQLQTAFEAEEGLLKPGLINYLLPLFLALAALLFFSRAKKLISGGRVLPDTAYKCFRAQSAAYPLAYYLAALLFIAGGLMTLIASELLDDFFFRLVGLFAILTGLGFPAVCSCARKKYAPNLVCFFMSLPILLYALWLVGSYKIYSIEPALASFYVQILMICCVLAALFYLAGLAFGRFEPKRCLGFTMLAGFLCMTCLAENLSTGLLLIILGTAVMLLLSSWMLVVNSEEKQDEPEEKPEEEKSVEPEGEDSGSETEALKPGQTPPENEPTKRFD